MLVEKFDEARLLWDAKGWTIEGLALEIAEQIESGKRPELKEFGFSEATLSRRSVTSRYMPKPLAEVVEGLEPLKGREHLTEIVETGLRVMRGEQGPAKSDSEKLAKELLMHFPKDEFAKMLADALAKEAGSSSGVGSLVSVFARAVAARMPRVRQLRVLKVARVVTAHLSHELDRLTAKRLAMAGAAGGLAGGAVACGTFLLVGVVVLLVLAGRLPTWDGSPSGVAQAPAATNTTQPIIIVTNVAQGGTPVLFDLGTFLGAIASGEMGKKVPAEQYVPDRPLPGQKLPPCDAGLWEKEVNGGCWMKGEGRPPCSKLFRHEDGCYRPIAADPAKPVGQAPEERGGRKVQP